MIKQLSILLFMLMALVSNAQEATNGPDMADNFRADGKIYVVIAVLATIFICVVVYLAVIERKLKKLEEELKHKK